jgi:hypothetical protein
MNAPPGMVVDHINRNKRDNRRCNLRVCTQVENMRNRCSTYGSSKFKGVSWDARRKKWMAAIHINGTQIRIGFFADEVDAAKAYDRKARELFGEFAYLNFPGAIRIVNLSGRIIVHSHIRGKIRIRKFEIRMPKSETVSDIGEGGRVTFRSLGHLSFEIVSDFGLRASCLSRSAWAEAHPTCHHPGSGTYARALRKVTAWCSWAGMATGPPQGRLRITIRGEDAVFDKFILERDHQQATDERRTSLRSAARCFDCASA